MDTFVAYWKHLWFRFRNPAEENQQTPRHGETNDEYIGRQPIHRSRAIWLKDANGKDAGMVREYVRYLELTGTWVTSYHYSDGRVTHHQGKPKVKRSMYARRKRTIPSR